MQLVTAQQMQEMDKQTIENFGIPGLVLMENAGRGAVKLLIEQFGSLENKKIAVLAGRGNNGGDGFVMARYLMEKGIYVNCFLLSQKTNVKGDAKVNLDLAEKLYAQHSNGRIIEIPDAEVFKTRRAAMLHHDLFIDAVLGTGLNSDVRGFYKDAIELMNASGKPIFAVDIPSGLHSDTGKPLGTATRAGATATFAFAKIGHLLYPGNTYTGKLGIVDIGIPAYIAQEKNLTVTLVEKDEIKALFPPRKFNSHKGTYGHLAVLAGSPGKTGAAVLCANAAARSGVGLVTLGVAKGIHKRIESRVAEAMTAPLEDNGSNFLTRTSLDDIIALASGKQAIAIGPGIGTHKDTARLVKLVIQQSDIPMVLDADALNCIADEPDILKKKKAPIILTPHPGEMARLTGMLTSDIQAGRLKVACDFAVSHDVTLVLKGAQTIIASPSGHCAVNATGNPGMASGGMGDVLTGMIAGFLAQGFSAGDAAKAGVYIHGLCADRLARETGAFGYLASDIINDIPKAIHQDLI